MAYGGVVVLKGHIHAKKEKARNNVCGAAGEVGAEGARTRQKEKSRKWRVRSHPQKPQTTALHTPKRKKQKMTCAERQGKWVLKGHAHVKKEKAGNNVCGATPKREPAHALKKNPTTIIKNKTSGNFFQPHSILLL